MNKLEEQIAKARELEAKQAATTKDAVQLEEERKKTLKTIRDKIMKGATTGDKIRDMIIIRRGLPDETLEKRYRQLDQQIQQHAGELVLVIHRAEEKHTHRGCFGGEGPRPTDYALETSLTIGLLTGKPLVIKATEGEYSIPTEAYVLMGRHGNPTKRTEDLVPHSFDGELDELTTKVISPHTKPYKNLEILVGDGLVMAWLKENIHPDEIRNIKKLLGLPKKAPLEIPAAAD